MRNICKLTLCGTFLATAVLTIAGCSNQSPGPAGWTVGDTARGYGLIYHTSNGGKNWLRQGSAEVIPNVSLSDVSAIDDSSAWVVGANHAGYGVILRTGDAGKTWQRQGSKEMIPDVEFLGVDAVDNGTAWIVGMQGTILHTVDAGTTWTRQADSIVPEAELQAVFAVDSNNVWVVGKGSDSIAVILRTSNGGKSWVKQGRAKEVPTDHLIDISAPDSSTAWAAGGNFSFLLTTDAGSSWSNHQPIKGLYDANSCCAVTADTIWFVTDNDGIFYSTDGGRKWGKQKPPVYGFYLLGVSAVDGQKAWAVGSSWNQDQKGVILHTSNAGGEWIEQSTPENAALRRISFAGARK